MSSALKALSCACRGKRTATSARLAVHRIGLLHRMNQGYWEPSAMSKGRSEIKGGVKYPGNFLGCGDITGIERSRYPVLRPQVFVWSAILFFPVRFAWRR